MYFSGHFITSGQKLPPAPYNLKPCKGLKNAFLSRSFADFAIHHEISQQFRLWVSFTDVPDETFFPTLARIKDVKEISPQNYNITLDSQDQVPIIPGLRPRYSKWESFNLGCGGKYHNLSRGVLPENLRRGPYAVVERTERAKPRFLYYPCI